MRSAGWTFNLTQTRTATEQCSSIFHNELPTVEECTNGGNVAPYEIFSPSLLLSARTVSPKRKGSDVHVNLLLL